MPPTIASKTASSRAQKQGASAARAPARSSRRVAPESLPAPQPRELLECPGVDERIRLRAYDLYEARGRAEGHALADWLAAESELRGC